MDDYPLLLDAAATGLRITHSPSTAKDEVNAFFTQRIPGACDEVATKITNLDPNLRSILLAQLQCNTFKSTEHFYYLISRVFKAVSKK